MQPGGLSQKKCRLGVGRNMTCGRPTPRPLHSRSPPNIIVDLIHQSLESSISHQCIMEPEVTAVYLRVSSLKPQVPYPEIPLFHRLPSDPPALGATLRN